MAVSNLMTKIDQPVVDYLCASIKKRGMAKFLSHDIVAKDILNASWSSGQGNLEHWKDQLRNTNEVAPRFES